MNRDASHTSQQRGDGWAIVSEGSVDRVLGRPRMANPYVEENSPAAAAAWLFGWDTADFYVQIRGQEEATRWLDAA